VVVGVVEVFEAALAALEGAFEPIAEAVPYFGIFHTILSVASRTLQWH
jgi:hypothetical protein